MKDHWKKTVIYSLTDRALNSFVLVEIFMFEIMVLWKRVAKETTRFYLRKNWSLSTCLGERNLDLFAMHEKFGFFVT